MTKILRIAWKDGSRHHIEELPDRFQIAPDRIGRPISEWILALDEFDAEIIDLARYVSVDVQGYGQFTYIDPVGDLELEEAVEVPFGSQVKLGVVKALDIEKPAFITDDRMKTVKALLLRAPV